MTWKKIEGTTENSFQFDEGKGPIIKNESDVIHLRDKEDIEFIPLKSRHIILNPTNSSGAPTSGTWEKGTIITDSNGDMWRCVSSGTPGTWKEVSSGGSSYSRKNTFYLTKEGGHFSTLAEVQTFLDSLEAAGQLDGVTIVCDSGEYDVSDTFVVDYSFIVSFRGEPGTKFNAASGLSGKPMFHIHSECYFDTLTFDGSTLENWKDDEEACIIETVGDSYLEVVNCFLYDAYEGVHIYSNADVWVFNFGIYNMTESGICFDSSVAGGSLDAEVGDIGNCQYQVRLETGDEADIFLDTLRFLNEEGQIGIDYVPENFINYKRIVVSSCSYSYIGIFATGFDFSLERDKDIVFKGNIGYPDSNPEIDIKAQGSTETTTLVTPGVFYKLNFTLYSKFERKITWNHTNKRATYLSSASRHGKINFSGSIQSGRTNKTLTLALFKNGSVLLGTSKVRVTSSGVPLLFSCDSLLGEFVNTGDYFELYCKNDSGTNLAVTLTDLNFNIILD